MPRRKFQPGQSGNPSGRPKGKTAATLLRKSIADAMPEILEKLVALAKDGDIAAAKALLDRAVPPLKPVAANVSLSVPNEASLTEQGAAVVNAILTGSIPPDIGGQLIAALSNQAKLIEVDELIKRIEELEKKQ
ncbi:DUF5681 domain-containing protein [Methylomonas sp. MK1]|uniref:DUF5681 domain-containing protein n=1 Tax=Methylomonas sp. MK1 TaxID=1131552 RepID=UPI00037CCADE|nr:DUF5681 domain-containing protein [Methylomonas sp. MK1]